MDTVDTGVESKWAFLTSKRYTLSALTVCWIGPFIGLLSSKRPLSDFLLTGGVIGAVASIIVIVDISLNKKGSGLQLLQWRAVADLGIAFRFLLSTTFNYYTCGQRTCAQSGSPTNFGGCSFPAFVLEFFEIASEGWFFMVALNLYNSFTNPFASFDARSKLYHFIVWSVSLIFASCLAGKHYINGYWSVNDSVDDTAICWISLTRGEKFSNPYPWLFFYVPIIVVYLYAVAILIIAYQRLKSGISDTILYRLQALVVNSINVTVYVIYWFIEFVLYLFAFDPDLDEHTADIFLKTFLFIIASKGIFALSVWILSANVAKKVAKQDTSDVAGGIDLNGALRSEVLAYATRFIRHCAQKGATLQKNQPEQLFRITHKEDDGAKNPLSPWFFVCLLVGRDKERQELKMLAKKSRRRSVMPDIRASQDARLSQRSTIKMASFNVANSPSAELEEAMRVSDVKTDGEQVVEGSAKSSSIGSWILNFFGAGNKVVEFTEFEPYHFRRVRQAAKISDETYSMYFSERIKERLVSGGASGAFFFFSKDEVFLAKSCTEEEANVLKDNAKEYADYLTSENGKNTYIAKIYGAYMLKIYSTSLYFFVMSNLFYTEDKLTFHEKYDIKGSTVGRSATPPKDGDKETCTHCEQKFVYHKKKKRRTAKRGIDRANTTSTSGAAIAESGNLHANSTVENVVGDGDNLEAENLCSVTVSGEHEPSVILKDNDLKFKIRLPRPDARELLKQLENDADFLFKIGVMDYSLLMGVHNTEYKVREDERKSEDSQRASDERQREMSIDPDVKDTENPLHRSLSSTSSSSSSDELRGDSVKLSLGDSKGKFARSLKISGDAFDEAKKEKSPFCSTRLEAERVVGPQAYQVGIIDFQQKWTWKKKVERFLKVNVKGNDSYGLSAIEPETYRKRFVDKIEDMLDLDDNEHSRTNNIV